MIAPDKFKGSAAARQVADAIVAGLRDVWGRAVEYQTLPLADGGDGTVAAFIDEGAREVRVTVRGPLGVPVEAAFARAGDLAVVEMAAASGLALLGPERAPRDATTFGTGELIRAALDAGARRLIVAIGGSATTDGGAGALAALGVRFLDADGAELTPSPAGLATLARIDASALDPRLAGVAIEVACDVENPLLGPAGAAAVYGPQKGADAAGVAFLDGILERLADAATAATGRDERDRPGAGAAGGLGWGLATFAGARLRAGFAIVADARGLGRAMLGATLCITGEGRIDAQTFAGKVVDGVATCARNSGVETIALCGSVDPAAEAALWRRGVAVLPILDGPRDLADAMREAPALIRAAAARLARLRRIPV